MKKYFILTSVFALTACGGGSGGGGSAPNNVVTPDVDNSVFYFSQIDSDTGLGMIDINQTRTVRYARAKTMVQSIESESNINSDALIARTVTTARTSTSDSVTAQEINHAYDVMSDIFVNGNTTGYTNHDVLMALALVFVDKSQIFNLLNMYNGNNLGDKIQGFSQDLTSENKPDNIKEVIASARDLYRDFGSEFTSTLKDARFYHSNNEDRYYTFTFNENNELTGIKDENDNFFAKEANGTFTKERVQGYEYTFSFSGDGFSDDIEIFYETEPDANTLKTDLRAKIDTDWGTDAHYEAIVDLLNNANLYSIGGSSNGTCTDEEEIDNAIVGRYADYTEKLKLETGSKDLGLKYSDFGLKYTEMEFGQNDGLMMGFGLGNYVYSEHDGFVGGYEDKRATPTSEMTFVGDAYAGLTRKQSDEEIENTDVLLEPQNNYYKGKSNFIVKQSGNLVDLEQKLIADFSDAGWYKVTVDNIPLNGHGGVISFDNSKGNDINDDWVADPENEDGKIENMTIKYYGPEPNNPTESVGLVQYIENKIDSGDWTFKADITFGAKKE